MKELVFSVEEIFDAASKNGCLTQYESNKYYIPAYQRGYKWSSDKNGAVSLLLNDLWEACLASTQHHTKEYYLQYITVKQANASVNDSETGYLEVIDGQQRLTTLSILLSVYAALQNKNNIAAGKLHYAIRDNFFTDHIYQTDSIRELCTKKWTELENDPAYNKQDIYYMFHAVKRCYDFLTEKDTKQKEDFYNYLLGQVKLIVNSVEKHIKSETVFKNLNSNKVPLSEAELIKGFLITKAGRINTNEQKTNFKEILEIRANIGRKWDEMNRWANDKRIRSFFFNNMEDGMHQLLLLTAMRVPDHSISKDSNYSLFNFYHKQINANALFQLLNDTQATLSDWYSNNDTYNLLGFCRFSKNSRNNRLSFIKSLLDIDDKVKLKAELNSKKVQLLKSEKTCKDMRYGEDDDQIHAILLALSAFSAGMDVRFDFFEFEQKKWSLEHIFPQSPEGKDKVLNEKEKAEILNMLGEKATAEIKEILQKEVRNENEKQIYYKALKEHQHLNSIGNMCLLTSPDNSSNGCMFFDQKRANILKLIRRGSFVPKHSFDVFSKMIEKIDNMDLGIWCKDDIEKHIDYIHGKLYNL